MPICRWLMPCCRHVAGTIGARGGNGLGVAGVNWNVKLLSGKFLGSTGGTTANAVKAVGKNQPAAAALCLLPRSRVGCGVCMPAGSWACAPRREGCPAWFV